MDADKVLHLNKMVILTYISSRTSMVVLFLSVSFLLWCYSVVSLWPKTSSIHSQCPSYVCYVLFCHLGYSRHNFSHDKSVLYLNVLSIVASTVSLSSFLFVNLLKTKLYHYSALPSINGVMIAQNFTLVRNLEWCNGFLWNLSISLRTALEKS